MNSLLTHSLLLLMTGFSFFASANNEISLKQAPKDLLAGVSNAVCYSGFRTGQHPDRGNGAVNPSKDEILEDLQILDESGFQLIRLYDCGENTKLVLQVIKNISS